MKNAETDDPKNFPTMFKDNLAFMANYNKGVPKLDVCKPDENGSYPLAWLVGDKSINYRWEKSDGGVRYMYLQANPITWFLGLVGIILSLILIIGRVVFKTPIKNKNLFYLITTFADFVCYLYGDNAPDRTSDVSIPLFYPPYFFFYSGISRL